MISIYYVKMSITIFNRISIEQLIKIIIYIKRFYKLELF